MIINANRKLFEKTCAVQKIYAIVAVFAKKHMLISKAVKAKRYC